MSRRWIAAVIALAAGLALSGCWTSQKLLLDPAMAANPLPAGIYLSPKLDPMRARIQGRGWYALGSAEEDEAVARKSELPMLLVPLPAGGRDVYAFATAANDCVNTHEACEGWTYGLVRVRAAAAEVAYPDCAKTLDLAKAHSGVPGGTGGNGECEFTDAAALKAALVALAKTPGAFEQTYTRRR